MNSKEFFSAWLELINNHNAVIPWYLKSEPIIILGALLLCIVYSMLFYFYCKYKGEYQWLLFIGIGFSMYAYFSVLLELSILGINKLDSFKEEYNQTQLNVDLDTIKAKYNTNLSDIQIEDARMIVKCYCKTFKKDKCTSDSRALKNTIKAKIENPNQYFVCLL